MSESKTIYVFSDSHGKTDEMIKLIRSGHPDMVLHLGDNVADARIIEKATGIICHTVRGNCDFGDTEETIKDIHVSGQKITMTHGDRYAAKYSSDRLIYLGQEHESKIVLFGHTHVSFCEYTGGLWVVNPGSISLPRDGMPSYAELIVGKFGVVPKIRKII